MASSIPHLSTLRQGRGGPRLRGRRGPPIPPQGDTHVDLQDDPAARDQVVQRTDGDASSSRLSAIELGYLSDEYARAFAGPAEPAAKRFPIINRGTYVRTTAIDLLVARFLHANMGRRKQIISLGAGSDTRFFRLLDVAGPITYHELDFEPNVLAKRAAIERSSLLSDRLSAAESSGSKYMLHEIDLRLLHAADLPDGIDPALPTLILSECCLCYLLPDEASKVLDFFANKLHGSISVVIYEPIRPDDAFGRTMVSNLASRGIRLQTINEYATLESQRQRLNHAGFTTGQGALDVYQIWRNNNWTTEAERDRIDRLEWLDEVEEWELLAGHYCVAWACRGQDLVEAWSGLGGSADG